MTDRAVTRVRHELLLRLLDVIKVDRAGPHLVRITLGGEQLRGFASVGFDDHVKVFFPATGETFHSVPELGSNGPVFDAGSPRPVMRDYTPHHFDPIALTLQLDFAQHEAGPATDWAARAQPGDRIIVGGPRGSFVVGTGFDWHLLVGDDTALPAIRKRLAELPEGARAIVFAEIDGTDDEQPLESNGTVEVTWVHRERSAAAGSALVDAVAKAPFPTGDFYAWVGCESADAKALRTVLLGKGADKAALKASGYWRRGDVATHDVHE